VTLPPLQNLASGVEGGEIGSFWGIVDSRRYEEEAKQHSPEERRKNAQIPA
jgi:hypothetical protein